MTTKTQKNAMPVAQFDAFDYSIADASKSGVKMVWKDGNGEPITHQAEGDDAPRELHLVLLGPEAGETSRVFKQIQHRYKKRGESHSPSDTEVEADRQADSKAIARLVVGGLMFTEGAWVELNAKNAGDFLYGIGPLRGQALDFINDAGNFTAKSVASKG